jgi:2-dehydropantoate 2-reductase
VVCLQNGLESGRHPHGLHLDTAAVAAALRAAGFDARAVADIARWKRAKLLRNLGNAVGALCGTAPAAVRLLDRVRAEGARGAAPGSIPGVRVAARLAVR